MSSLWDFPNITIKIYKLKLLDSLYKTHHRETVLLNEVSTSISVMDAFKEELKITDISAKKGSISIFVDDDHYTNTYVFKANSKHKKNTIKIISDDIDILIEDLEFTFTEKIKNKRITAHINKIDFNIDAEKMNISTVNLDVLMKEMGLNLEKGTFFNNARCVGSLRPKINQELHTIEIPKFDLKIEDQLFDVAALINTKTKNFIFNLGLEDVNYTETTHLLANNLKSRLEGFDILKPFKVSAEISGKFEYKNLTLVALQYETKNNEIVYKKDSLHFKNIDFKGKFINRFYLDSTLIENRKNYTFAFDSLSGDYHNIPFRLSNVSLKHKYSNPLQLVTDFDVEGEVAMINDLINSKEYNVTNGTFAINGNYNGVLKSLSEILKTASFNLKIKQLVIKSTDRLSRFYIPIADLKIDHNNAAIKKIIVSLDKKNRMKIQGDILNFATLLTHDKENIPAISNVKLSSDYLNFNSLLKPFGARKKHKNKINLAQVKKSINTLVSKFNPSILFTIKKLDFFDIPFNDINLKALAKNKQINIDNISGKYKDGGAEAKIIIGLNPKQDTQNEEVLKVNMQLKVTGKIEHWAEMMHSDKFFFRDANYHLDLNFNDEASTVFELINRSDILLNVNEGTMLYKPSNLTLPFRKISIHIKNKDAFLNDFELNLPKQQSLHLKGQITNFSNLFDNSIITKNISSSIIVFSEDLDFSNFVDTFNPTSQKPEKKAAQKNNVKSILNDLYTGYKPILDLDFKKLSYNNVSLEKLKAKLEFEGKNNLHIKNVSCYFYDKKLTLDADIDISKNNETLFTTNFSLDNFAIENLLLTFDNFGYKQLNAPTEITGLIKLNANFNGLIDDTKGVDFNSLNAKINYNIKSLAVKDFEPIIEAGNKIFRKKRFENIKFAHIKSSVTLDGNLITIPETNVQSTAFDFFMEGVLDNSNRTNLWISVPLSNIKRRDLAKPPKRKSFDESGKKIYLGIKADKNGKLEHKVYLRDKKHLKN